MAGKFEDRENYLQRNIQHLKLKVFPDLMPISYLLISVVFFLLFTSNAKLFLTQGSGSVQNFQHVTPANHKDHSLLLFNTILQYLRVVKQELLLILTFIIQHTSYR